jgi:Ca2+-binding EF-hand superfamily protein
MPRPKAEVAAEAARIKSIDTKEEEEALDEEDPAIKMEEALLKAFKTVDEDKSGELDRAEVKFLIELMGSTIDGPELDAAMLELDTGGDGMVSFEEFKTYWNNNFTTGGTMLAGLIRRFASMPPVTNASGVQP